MEKSSKTHKVILLPSGKSVQVAEGASLLKALQAQGVYIKSTCGGVASCGNCVVKVQSGESNLSGATFAELKLLGNVFHITKERLACQTMITGDVTLDIAHHDELKDKDIVMPKMQDHKRPKVVVRKKADGPRPRQEEPAKAVKPAGMGRAKKFSYKDEE